MTNYQDVSNFKSYVFAFALDGKGKGELPSLDQEVEQQVWIHLDNSENDCDQALDKLEVPERVRESLLRGDTRPRAMSMEGGVLLILRVINSNPDDTPDDMISIRIWLEKNKMISVRQRKVFSVQDLKGLLEKGIGPIDIPNLVVSLVERVADRIAEYVDLLEDRLSVNENSMDYSNVIELRSEISVLRREAASVRRYLAPQREALDMFNRQTKLFLEENLGLTIYEQSDRITRYVEDLDLLRERALVLQEELMNAIAQQQNDRMFVLSVVAAIFLPISFVTGLFGMNVAGLPGTEEPWSFMILAGFMVTSVVATLSFFHFKKWL